jgi:hypothetical protein
MREATLSTRYGRDRVVVWFLPLFAQAGHERSVTGKALKEEEVEVVDEDGQMVEDGQVVTEKVGVAPEEILRKMLDNPFYDPVKLLGRFLGDVSYYFIFATLHY